MNIKKETVISCHNLLKNVLSEAFQLDVHYFTPPYGDFSVIDAGTRNIFWTNFNHKNNSLRPSKDHPDRLIYIVRSNLGFYNFIIYLNYKAHPDFFTIGPFRSEEFSISHVQEMLKTMNLSAEKRIQMERYYEAMPYVSLPQIYKVTHQILNSFFPRYKECKPIYVEFSDNTNMFNYNEQLFQAYNADFAVSLQKNLLTFLEHLTRGETEAAHTALGNLIKHSHSFLTQNASINQQNLSTLNDQCALAMMNTKIHPLHTIKVQLSFREKILDVKSRENALNVASDICHFYCSLIQNYEFTEYSKTVRNVINYINTHLEDELTLSLLAKEFQKNASSLSAAFSKEVGMSITNFIHRARIKEAIHLFNTTDQSVSEVALSVGFHDFAYFSRLFHKEVGYSPREYCKHKK